LGFSVIRGSGNRHVLSAQKSFELVSTIAVALEAGLEGDFASCAQHLQVPTASDCTQHQLIQQIGHNWQSWCMVILLQAKTTKQ